MPRTSAASPSALMANFFITFMMSAVSMSVIALKFLPGDGKAHLVEVAALRKHDLEARRLSGRDIEALKRPWIHVVLSVPRFATADAVLEKFVELGVHTVSFAVSEFSFIRKTPDVPESRIRRWEKIVRSATQQSGRGTLMNLRPARSLEDVLTEFKSTPRMRRSVSI